VTTLVNNFTTVAFYQAYECFFFFGCCVYLGTAVVIVTNVITDFLVTVIILVTEFTCSCRYLCYCVPKGYQYSLVSVNVRTSVVLTFFCLVLKFALCLYPLMLLRPILRRRQCVILERDLIG